MIKFKSVKIQNFLSFGNVPTEVNIDRKETLMIIGQNDDVGKQGQSRNGAGKSTIMQAVLFALFGKGIDKQMKNDDFINWTNKKHLMVELDFSVGNTSYKIRRGRKPNVVELYHYKDGEETSLTRDSMKNTDELIQSIIKIPYEVFIGTFFLSPHKDSFMAYSGPEQRSFIENILSLDVLAQRAETIKKMRAEMTSDLRVSKVNLENAEMNQQSIIQSLTRLQEKSDKFESDNQNQLALLRTALKSYTDVPVSELTELNDRIAELTHQIREIDSSRRETESEIRLIKNEISGERSAISKMQREVSSTLDAYNELTEALDTAEDELRSMTEGLDLEQLNKSYQDSCSRLEAMNSELSNINEELRERKFNIRDLEKEADDYIANYDKIEKELEVLSSGRCPYCDQEHTDKEKIAELEAALSEMTNAGEVTADALDNEHASVEQLKIRLKELTTQQEEAVSQNESLKITIHDAERAQRDVDYALKRLNSFDRDKVLLETTGIDFHAENLIEVVEERESEHIAKIDALEVQLAELKQKLDTLQSDSLREELKAHTERFNSFGYKIDELGQLSNKIATTEARISDITESMKTNPYADEIEILQKQKEESNFDHLTKEVSEIETKIEHAGYLVKLLTDSKSFVRKRIVEQYIPFLNKKILENTEFLGLPHVPVISSDLSVTIGHKNNTLSYYNLSQGERLRLNIATTMAFKDLMGTLGKNCNLVMCDEVFDSALDSYGMHRAFSFVKDCAENVWLISHREEFYDSVDRKMIVKKSSDFSTVSFE